MKQLCYTCCLPGQSIGGGGGQQIRAASRGLSRDQTEEAIRYAGYQLPYGIDIATPPADPPVRLAFLNTQRIGRVLCHSIYVGRDPSSGRLGNFFSHLLLDLPDDIDPRQVIQSWGSTFWLRSNFDGGTELPEVTLDQVIGSPYLVDEAFTRFLSEERHQDFFQYVLSAVLSLPTHGRLFIAAPAETVAFYVYGLLRVLPAQVRADLTFSTYEHAPLSCSARLVGTSWGGRTDLDLPPECYAPPNVGLNCFTGYRSESCHPLPFVNHLVPALAKGCWQCIDQFLDTCEQLGLSESELIDRMYRMEMVPDVFDQNDAREVLRNSQTARLLLASAKLRSRLVTWLRNDPQFSREAAMRIAQTLYAEQAASTGLANSVQDEVRTPPELFWLAIERLLERERDVQLAQAMVLGRNGGQLTKDDSRRALRYDGLRTWISGDQDLVACVIGWALEDRIYAEECLPLLIINHPQSKDFQIGDVVVNRAVKAAQQGELDQLKTALEVVLPRVAPEHGGGAAQVAAKLRQPDRVSWNVWKFLLPYVAKARSKPNLRAWLTVPADWLSDLLELEIPCEQKCTACLEVLRRDGKLERRAIRQLLKLPEVCCEIFRAVDPDMSSDEEVVRLFEAVLEEQPPEKFEEFFERLHKTPDLHPKVRERLHTRSVVKEFLNNPTLDDCVLREVERYLAYFQARPSQQARFHDTFEKVVEATTHALLSHSTARFTQTDLENVLLRLGRFVPEGPVRLYRDLLNNLTNKQKFWNAPRVQAAFVGIGIGASRSSELRHAVQYNLLVDALKLAERVAKNFGIHAFTEIERNLIQCPRASQQIWQYFKKFVKPKNIWQRYMVKAGYFLIYLVSLYIIVSILLILILFGLL
jgi:hypothetical protein